VGRRNRLRVQAIIEGREKPIVPPKVVLAGERVSKGLVRRLADMGLLQPNPARRK